MVKLLALVYLFGLTGCANQNKQARQAGPMDNLHEPGIKRASCICSDVKILNIRHLCFQLFEFNDHTSSVLLSKRAKGSLYS